MAKINHWLRLNHRLRRSELAGRSMFADTPKCRLRLGRVESPADFLTALN
jgi:hypothetical protein